MSSASCAQDVPAAADAPSTTPVESDSSDEDVGDSPRDRVRKKVRKRIVRGLAKSAGKHSVEMHWDDRFGERVVLRAKKLLVGWPAHILFGELCRIPGGLKPMQELLDAWEAGTLHWRDATPEELQRARRDPRSVLPNTPLPPRRRPSPPPAEGMWTVGTLTMLACNLDTVIRCKTPRPGSSVDDGPRPAKRRRVDKPVGDVGMSDCLPPLPQTQRRDINTVRVRRFRNHLNGPQTARYVLDDPAAPGGYVPLDNDLGRALERGSVVVSGVAEAFSDF